MEVSILIGSLKLIRPLIFLHEAAPGALYVCLPSFGNDEGPLKGGATDFVGPSHLSGKARFNFCAVDNHRKDDCPADKPDGSEKSLGF